jgi:hypothetical protein
MVLGLRAAVVRQVHVTGSILDGFEWTSYQVLTLLSVNSARQ